ncbi:hypothetical protein [Nitrosospira sp. NRS527]|uniref:hypothetical protein n=1 Tax=Nitrosospira sp. NRS527 TaxID=155925 RepID=UPI001AF957AE|nr:hypothetical protein [Nitrosospira sp. NRS527]BCT66548.1 hypothetical protein NNRS527_00111 [Nitrosospira sp. NRS527]
MTDQFERTAVKLSQRPLGIIALFIVLIHGFASLVVGFTTNIGENNQSILVWFLVLFPVIVFLVFAWLVSFRHVNLYPPEAFPDPRVFADLATLTYGQAKFDNLNLQKYSQSQSAAPPHSLRTSATGSLYWLGHDLMWTADILLRKGPAEQALIGLAQARHHLVQVGLGETPIEYEIVALNELIKLSEELSPSLRDKCASQLGSIIDRIGMVAEAAQANFQVPPHWTRVRSQKTRVGD